MHVALQAAKADVGEPLIIFNIDTMRPRCDVPTDVGWDGWVECFNAEGDGWSFVLPDLYKPNVAREVVEKRRVSDLCSTGVYYFPRSRQLFEWAYAAELAQPSVLPNSSSLLSTSISFVRARGSATT